jgi:hypothetical protein
MRFLTKFTICSLALMAGCSPSSSSDETLDSPAETDAFNLVNDAIVAEEAPPQAGPDHRYITREGELYGYVTAVSEEDKKRGRAAGDVLMFRYEGVHKGIYELTAIDGSGRPQFSYECTRPCTAIKAYSWQGIERWEFNPDSVIGAAFIDAFNGKLEPTRRKPATLPPPIETVPSGEAASNATGAEPPAENVGANGE